ncbi:MAG TPA: purine-nucleoside phosphorylase [Terriglobia bacterium]|nr:purine-nucleoside phosphorylase [Terriglobia bacterium]
MAKPKSKAKRQLGYDEAQRAARYITTQAGFRPGARPRVGIILGSGLGAVARSLEGAKQIPYRRIPHFPRSTVVGHAGELHLGRWSGVPVAILAGRMHLYEGYTAAEVVFPTRVLALLGVETLIVTCAAGGIAPQAAPGSFLILADHINMQGQNPLAGAHDARWGARFIDMSQAYDPALRRAARNTAAALRLKCSEGVYASLLGPSFETPAEIRALRRCGADAVGMSTVPEVIAARQAGVRVLGIATITNRAAGLSRQPLSHEEVLEMGKTTSENLIRFLDTLLPKL